MYLRILLGLFLGFAGLAASTSAAADEVGRASSLASGTNLPKLDSVNFPFEASPYERDYFIFDVSIKSGIFFLEASRLVFQSEFRDEDWAKMVEASVSEAVSASSAVIVSGQCRRSLCEYILGDRVGDRRRLTGIPEVSNKIIAEAKKNNVPVTIYVGRKDVPIHPTDPVFWYLYRLTGPDDFMHSIPVEIERLKAARLSGDS